MSTSTPMTFIVTHICHDQVTASGKTKVLLNVEGVRDDSLTLSTLLDLSLFNPAKPLAKFQRLTTADFKFEAVETDYEDADGNVWPLDQPGLGLEVDESFLRKHPPIEGPGYI